MNIQSFFKRLNKRWALLIALVMIGIALPLALVVALRPTAVSVPDLQDPQRIAAGQQIYRQYCSFCHGANLEGQPNWTTRLPSGRMPAPPHDESGHTWHHPSQVLFAVTKDGMKPPHAPENYQSDMPAFGSVLSDDEIWSVLAFIRSRWPERISSRHSQLDRQYAKQQR